MHGKGGGGGERGFGNIRGVAFFYTPSHILLAVRESRDISSGRWGWGGQAVTSLDAFDN